MVVVLLFILIVSLDAGRQTALDALTVKTVDHLTKTFDLRIVSCVSSFFDVPESFFVLVRALNMSEHFPNERIKFESQPERRTLQQSSSLA